MFAVLLQTLPHMNTVRLGTRDHTHTHRQNSHYWVKKFSFLQALGFISMVLLLFDVLLAFLALRAFSDSREFEIETEKSKSALYAVKSGRSLAGCRSAQVHSLMQLLTFFDTVILFTITNIAWNNIIQSILLSFVVFALAPQECLNLVHFSHYTVLIPHWFRKVVGIGRNKEKNCWSFVGVTVKDLAIICHEVNLPSFPPPPSPLSSSL